jgi:multidrug efflux pump
MISIIDFAIQRTRTTLVLLLMVLLVGLLARIAIPIEADPHIEVPVFFIAVPHEGIAPEDAERLLILPIETELRAVAGVKEFNAYAGEGFGHVVVEFDATHDLNRAAQDVRNAVDRAKPKLPSTAEEPVVTEALANDFPLVQIHLQGSVPERVLYNTAIRLKNTLENLTDVLEVRMNGHREEVLEATIDPTLLESYQISAEQLMSTVTRNNRLIAAGALDTAGGRFAVKVPSIIEDAGDAFGLPVKTNGDTVVTLGEISEIRRTFKDRTQYTRFNGEAAITLDVLKRTNANAISASNQVKATVDRLRPDLPAEVQINYGLEQAPFAQRQVTELQGNILTALALVMVLVVAALGLRSGLIVGLAIPTSLLLAVALLYVIGFTFNFMVMFGMLLALGMLIDGAIVVTEYADRKMSEGFDRRAAYSMSAKRMFWPVTASVATTMAAFLPLMFWPGVAGKFMSYLPVTVFTVLAASWLYALVFGPTLGSLFGRAGARDARATATLRQLEDGDPTQLPTITGSYSRLLVHATHHAPATILVTVGLLVSAFVLYGKFGQGMMFLHQAEPMYAQVLIKSQGNLSAAQINRLVQEAEREILPIAGIKSLNVNTRLGGGTRGAQDLIGQLFVELHDESERAHKASEIFEEMRHRTRDLAGIKVEIRPLEQGPPIGKPIQLEFRGHNRAVLASAVRDVRGFVENLQDMRDVEDTLPLPGIEWQLKVDRAQAALFGADVATVGMAVQLVTNGLKVAEYRPDGAEDAVDIRIRYPLSGRGISALGELRVNTAQGLVPISSFVKLTPAPQLRTLRRVDGVAVHRLTADVAPGVLADTKAREIQQWLATQHFDPRLTIQFRGAAEEQDASIAFVQIAFLMALLLMFLLLVTQFNSLYQAGLILFAVVMSTAGVLFGLLIMQQPFSAILTGVGIVALAGIVVNNNIVLIDSYNHLRREHPELDPISQIVRTGAQRLRPVMLTTATTICGLLPMAGNLSIDLVNRTVVYGGQLSQFWVPLAQAIVFGLAFASLLTLVATPAMLALPIHLKRWVCLGRAWARPRRGWLQHKARRKPQLTSGI